MTYWKRQPKPNIKCINGIDGEIEILEDIMSDPIFKKFTEDIVPLINLNYIPQFKDMTPELLLIHQKLILAKLVMEMIYE